MLTAHENRSTKGLDAVAASVLVLGSPVVPLPMVAVNDMPALCLRVVPSSPTMPRARAARTAARSCSSTCARVALAAISCSMSDSRRMTIATGFAIKGANCGSTGWYSQWNSIVFGRGRDVNSYGRWRGH